MSAPRRSPARARRPDLDDTRPILRAEIAQLRGAERDPQCIACDAPVRAVLLCQSCAAALDVHAQIQVCHEQILSRAYRGHAASAGPSRAGLCIIDPFGRPHVFAFERRWGEASALRWDDLDREPA